VIRSLVIFYGEELLAPRPTPKLEGHPLPAVRHCLFNVFAATLHIRRPFLNETYSRVRVGKHLSDTFPIMNGLKQGDALLPLLFNFALEYAIRRV
jgi:hypothetical protein